MPFAEMQVAAAFPTLIGRFKVPHPDPLNRELRSLILDRARSEPNVPHANVGGWHSRSDLLEWPHPSVQTLKTSILEAVQQMIASTLEQMRQGGLTRSFNGSLALIAWANISRRGHYHALHNHPGSCWSGVYYVAGGGDAGPEHPRSGIIDLLDPRPFTEMVTVPGDPYGQKLSIRPEPGMMLVFPGFLYHFVHPFAGDGERISIAFNARVERR